MDPEYPEDAEVAAEEEVSADDVLPDLAVLLDVMRPESELPPEPLSDEDDALGVSDESPEGPWHHNPISHIGETAQAMTGAMPMPTAKEPNQDK